MSSEASFAKNLRRLLQNAEGLPLKDWNAREALESIREGIDEFMMFRNYVVGRREAWKRRSEVPLYPRFRISFGRVPTSVASNLSVCSVARLPTQKPYPSS